MAIFEPAERAPLLEAEEADEEAEVSGEVALRLAETSAAVRSLVFEACWSSDPVFEAGVGLAAVSDACAVAGVRYVSYNTFHSKNIGDGRRT